MPYADHIPAYSRHKATGQATVCLNGRDFYLGTYGSAASRGQYNRLISEWMAGGRQLPPTGPAPLTIAEVMVSYRRHVEQYYRTPDGKNTNEVTTIRCALRPLRKLYGTTPAGEFGPLKLIALRDAMIGLGWARTTINKQIVRVRGFFKWAVSRELIPASIHQALSTVRGLGAGRSKAAETVPVRPAPQEDIDAALPFMLAPVAAMVRLQLLTGARPGELTIMTMAALDMSGPVWKYTPIQHKTRHHGHARTILIGPQSQVVLKPFLTADPTRYLFRPSDAVAERRAKLAAARKTPLTQVTL